MRAPRPILTLLSLVLLALTGRPTARAEDEPSPAERFREACRALPAPDEARAFDWAGEILLNGQVMGTCRLAAAVVLREEGGAAWQVHDQAAIGGAFQLDVRAVFDRGLELVSAQGRDKDPGEDARFEVRRMEKALHVLVQPEGGEQREGVVAAEGPFLAGPAATILFLRSVLDRPAAYEWRDFSPSRFGKDAAEKPLFKTVSGRVVGPGTWRGRKVLLAETLEGKKLRTFAFDPTTKAFLGLTMTEEAVAMRMEFLPPGSAGDGVPADVLEKPAGTPEVAVARYYLAAGTHDLKLLDESFHWPTVFEHFKAGNAGYEGTQEAFRELILGNYRTNWQSQEQEDREAVVAFLRANLANMAVQEAGERLAIVTVADGVPGIGGQKWLVVLADGHWFIAK